MNFKKINDIQNQSHVTPKSDFPSWKHRKTYSTMLPFSNDTKFMLVTLYLKLYSFLFAFFIVLLTVATAYCMSTLLASANVEALVGIGAPTVQALTYPKWGLRGTNKESSAQN